MKTKLRDKLVKVTVLDNLLVYSLDCLTTKDGHKGDVIEIPQWMVEGLVSEGRVTTDVTEEKDAGDSADDSGHGDDDDSDSDNDGDSDDDDEPLTIAELKELTETDFEDLKTTADCIEWASWQIPLKELKIHPACKIETSITKILEACAELTVED